MTAIDPQLPPDALLPFVQFELVRPVGPAAGSYLLAGADGATETLVIVSREAAVARPRRRRRATAAEQPAPVELTLAIHVLVSRGCRDVPAAAGLLAAWRSSAEQARELVERALDVVNLAVRAHRVAARDPYVTEVATAEARAVRIGYGTAADVVRGDWAEAFVPAPAPPSRTRHERLRGSVAVADVLAGRAGLDPAAELLLRAEADIDQRRLDCAVFQLQAAAEALAGRPAGDAAAREQLDRARGLAAQAGAAASPDTRLLEAEQLADRLWALVDPAPGRPTG